jgi:DNA-directed RNA polymerase subunit RPC12/RpoP
MTNKLTSTIVEFDPDTGLGPELKCPRCGFNYMHQGRVVVYHRVGGEDGSETDVTTVDGGLSATHRVPSHGAGNPSGRRQGLSITFDCEGCRPDGSIELLIAQHKGNTVFSWRFDPRQRDDANG